jgi:hypothetical protein
MKASVRVAVLVVAALGAVGARAEIIDRVLAVVGSQVVTLSDVHAVETFGDLPTGMSAANPSLIFESLVDRELMLGEIERYAAPDADPAQVDRRMAQIRAKFPGTGAYEQALARTAMTADRLRAFVAGDLRIDAYLEQRFGVPAQPTPDDVQRYYREHATEFTRAGHLLPLDEVRSHVEQQLVVERRRALVTEWLGHLRRVTHVEIGPAALAWLKSSRDGDHAP